MSNTQQVQYWKAFDNSRQKYINKLWKQFQEEGYVEDPISKRRFTKDLPEMHPQKLLLDNWFQSI